MEPAIGVERKFIRPANEVEIWIVGSRNPSSRESGMRRATEARGTVFWNTVREVVVIRLEYGVKDGLADLVKSDVRQIHWPCRRSTHDS